MYGPCTFTLGKELRISEWPKSRLHATYRKPKVSGGFGPRWAERIRTREACASRLKKEVGILQWPETWRGDSRQACESFARDRSQK